MTSDERVAEEKRIEEAVADCTEEIADLAFIIGASIGNGDIDYLMLPTLGRAIVAKVGEIDQLIEERRNVGASRDEPPAPPSKPTLVSA